MPALGTRWALGASGGASGALRLPLLDAGALGALGASGALGDAMDRVDRVASLLAGVPGGACSGLNVLNLRAHGFLRSGHMHSSHQPHLGAMWHGPDPPECAQPTHVPHRE